MCVVPVSFSLDVRLLRSQQESRASVFVSRANQGFEAKAYCQVVDPTRRTTSFHDEKVEFVFFEHGLQVVSLGRSVQEGMFPRFRIKKSTHGIEFAKVECENFHSSCPLGLGLEIM